MSGEPYEWLLLKRGDEIPKNAVFAGSTSTDSVVYVEKFDNKPGKVNLTGNKIYNFG